MSLLNCQKIKSDITRIENDRESLDTQCFWRLSFCLQGRNAEPRREAHGMVVPATHQAYIEWTEPYQANSAIGRLRVPFQPRVEGERSSLVTPRSRNISLCNAKRDKRFEAMRPDASCSTGIRIPARTHRSRDLRIRWRYFHCFAL